LLQPVLQHSERRGQKGKCSHDYACIILYGHSDGTDTFTHPTVINCHSTLANIVQFGFQLLEVIAARPTNHVHLVADPLPLGAKRFYRITIPTAP